MHAEVMEKQTTSELVAARAVEEHYIARINHAVATGRTDLIDELATQREVESTRSTSLAALLKRARRHT